MTRHMDTYMCVMGAAPLIWPWWLEVSERCPDILNDCPRDWVGWSVTIQEFDPDNAILRDMHTINHAKIMEALEYIVVNHDEFNTAVWSNALNLRNGNIDDVDFDSDSADIVLQWICFGEVKYG